MSQSQHYDEKYFEWQRKVGTFTCVANRIKFEEFVRNNMTVLDFGCGGGFMLAGLPAKAKLGVEINPTARKQAAQNGLTVFEEIELVPDETADLIISDNALEHTFEPLNELRKLFPKLKPGGKAVFVLPCEHVDMAYDPNDHNQHLFSWSPLCAGNLFKQAGFEVLSSKAFFHKHVPYSHRLRPLIGGKLFNLVCKLNGFINRRKWNEVRVIARRPLVGRGNA